MTRASSRSYILLRSVAIGVAGGSRTSLALVGPVLTSSVSGPWGVLARVGAVTAIAAELTNDKLPGTRSRLEQPGPPIRMAAGAFGAVVLARRVGASAVLPAILGALAGAVGTWGGAVWRTAAIGQRPDWQAAVAEDAVAIGLAACAVRVRPADATT